MTAFHRLSFEILTLEDVGQSEMADEIFIVTIYDSLESFSDGRIFLFLYSDHLPHGKWPDFSVPLYARNVTVKRKHLLITISGLIQ
jgi:hypothetical protein